MNTKRDWKKGAILFTRLGFVIAAIVCGAFEEWQASTFLLAGVIILEP